MTSKHAESSPADAVAPTAAPVDTFPGIPGDAIVDTLAAAQAEAAEMKDAWMRAKAEAENIRRIAQADVAKAHKFAIERFAEDLLPVKDALEQTLAAGDVSLASLRAGAELTLKALTTAFERAHVVELNPEGQKFDPNHHQAMQMVPSPLPANTVAAVFQKGYLVNDRVLRPALVTVSQGTGTPA
ncbi:MAG: nucleotide exchange factor GrpE [Betaproteobacteria bacterium]